MEGNPEIDIKNPTPNLTFNFLPKPKGFRKLTKSDLKLIDFITREGIFNSAQDLGRSINISEKTILKSLKDYQEKKLLQNSYHFFQLGLDLSLVFSSIRNKIMLPFPSQVYGNVYSFDNCLVK